MPSELSAMYPGAFSSGSLDWGLAASPQVPVQAAEPEKAINADLGVLVYGQTHTLDKDQLAQLTPDEYNFLYHKAAFEAQHGAAQTRQLEQEVYSNYNSNAAYRNDDRSLLRQTGDIALSATQAAINTFIGIPAVAGAITSFVPGKVGEVGKNVATAFGNLQNEVTRVTNDAFASDYRKQISKNIALADKQREIFQERWDEQHRNEGDGELMVGLKNMGRTIVEGTVNALSDQGRFEDLLASGTGSIVGASKLQKGINAIGKIIGASSKSKAAQAVSKALTAGEDASFARKLVTSEAWAIGLTEGGGSVADVVSRVKELTSEEILQSPILSKEVKDYLDNGDTLSQAIEKTKDRLAGSVAAWQVLATVPAAMLLGAATDSFSVIRNPTGTASWNPVKALGQSASHAVKEYAEEFGLPVANAAGNIAMNQKGIDTPWYQGIGQQMGEGGVAGAASGGALPAAGYAGRAAAFAGSVAALPAAIGISAIQANSLKHMARQAESNANTFNNLRNEINNNASFSQTDRDAWNARLNKLQGKANLDNIQQETGHQFSAATEATYDSNKSLEENQAALLRKAAKLKKKHPGEAQEIYNDLLMLQQFAQKNITEEETKFNQENAIINSFAVQAKDSDSEEAQLANALQQQDKQKQFSDVHSLMQLPSTFQQEQNETPEAFAQRQTEEKERLAREYIDAYNRLNIKDKENNTKSSVDMATDMLKQYGSISIAYNQLSSNRQALNTKLFNQRNNLATSSISAKVSNINAVFNQAENKLTNDNLNASLSTGISLLKSSESWQAQEVASERLEKLANNANVTKPVADALNKLSAALKAQAQAKQQYANNAEVIQGKDKQSIQQKFFGDDKNILQNALSALSDPKQRKVLARQVQTMYNRHQAITQALKDLASDSNLTKSSVDFWNEISGKKEILDIDRKNIADALAEERNLYVTYKGLEQILSLPDNMKLTTEVASRSAKDFKKGNNIKATFKEKYETMHSLNESLSQRQSEPVSEKPEPESNAKDKIYEATDFIEKTLISMDSSIKGHRQLSKKIASIKNTLNENKDIKALNHEIVKKLGNDIAFIETTLSRMEKTDDTELIQKNIQDMKNNLLANGYEIVDMLGKKYDSGMRVTANFVEDLTLPAGTQIITGVTKPQINYNGVMFQSAEITVRQNLNKPATEETDWSQENPASNKHAKQQETAQNTVDKASSQEKQKLLNTLIQQNKTFQGLPQEVVEALTTQSRSSIAFSDFYVKWPQVGETVKLSDNCTIKRLTLTSVEITNHHTKTTSIYALPGSSPTTFDGKTFDEWNQDKNFVAKYGKIIAKGYSANGSEYAITEKDYTRRVKMYDERTKGKDSGLDTAWHKNLRPIGSVYFQYLWDAIKNTKKGLDDNPLLKHAHLYFNENNQLLIFDSQTKQFTPVTYQLLVDLKISTPNDMHTIYNAYKSSATDKKISFFKSEQEFLKSPFTLETFPGTPIRESFSQALLKPFELGNISAHRTAEGKTVYEIESYHPSSGLRYIESSSQKDSEHSISHAVITSEENEEKIKQNSPKQNIKNTQNNTEKNQQQEIEERRNKQHEQFVRNVGTSPVFDVNTENITKVILDTQGVANIFAGSHVLMKRLSNGTWQFYAKTNSEHSVNITERAATKEEAAWAERIIANKSLLEEPEEKPSLTTFNPDLNPDRVTKIVEYSDGVVKIFTNDSDKNPAFEQIQGNWVIYTSRQDKPFILASKDTSDNLDNFYHGFIQENSPRVKTVEVPAYGKGSGSNIAEINRDNVHVTEKGTLIDNESKQQFVFSSGRWHTLIDSKKNKKSVIQSEKDSNALSDMLMRIVLAKTKSAALTEIIQHFFYVPDSNLSYSVRIIPGTNEANPAGLEIVKTRLDTKEEQVVARRLLENGTVHWYLLDNRANSLSAPVNTEAGLQAMEVLMSKADSQNTVQEYYDMLRQKENEDSLASSNSTLPQSLSDKLLNADSTTFNPMPEKGTTPGSLGIWDAMPDSLRSTAATIFNAVAGKNLLNRLADPMQDMNTFFNVIVPSWSVLTEQEQEETRQLSSEEREAYMEKRRKEKFKEFFYKNSEGNVRWEKLYDDIFHSKEDKNLKALQAFFTPDASQSLLYKLMADMDRMLPQFTPEKVLSFFANKVAESAAVAAAALGSTDTHNGNFFFFTKNADGKVAWNKPLLARAALGAVSAYLTLNQTENMDEDKGSLPLSLFNDQIEARQQVLSVIGNGAETDEHIVQQISRNVRDFLGLSHSGSGRQVAIEDAIVNSISKSLLAAMVANGLFTKHSVHFTYNNSKTHIESTRITSERSYVGNKPSDTETVLFGKAPNEKNQYEDHVFLTVNKANSAQDPQLFKLAFSMSTQLAFILENMMLEKHNENVAIGSENKFAEAAEGATIYNSQEKLTPTQRKEVKALDDAASYVNTEFLNVFNNLSKEAAEDFFDVLYEADASEGIANRIANESKKGGNVTLNTELQNANDLLTQLGNYQLARQAKGQESIPDNEVPVYFKHAITTMSRFMMVGGANTQASKLLRELFIPSSKATLAERAIDLNDEKMSNYLLRAICAGFGIKVNQASGIVTEANAFLRKELNNALKTKGNSTLFSRNAWKNFQKAIADNSLNEEIVNDLLHALKDCKKADHTWLSINACVELARLMNAMNVTTVNQMFDSQNNMKKLAENSKYVPNMYIENDGVTSGPSHAQHLLSTGMFTMQELRAKAAGGYSFAPGSYAESWKLAGRADIYVQTANVINEWFSTVSQSVVPGKNVSNLINSKFSTAINNEGEKVSLPVRTMNPDGTISYSAPEEVTPIRLLTSLLNAMHVAMPGGFEDADRKTFEESLLNEVIFKRSTVKSSVQVHTYEAGRDTITRNLLDEIIGAFLQMQTDHNILVQQRTRIKEGTAKYKELTEQINSYRRNIKELAMHLQQASLVTINDSLYDYDSNEAQFILDSNTESLSENLWEPALNESTGLYDTTFSLGPNAIRILSRNMHHLLINPLIDKLEQKVYSPESIKNKKLLVGVSTVLGTLYEGMEAYYIAQIARENKKSGTNITQEQLDRATSKLRTMIPRLVETLELELKNKQVKVHLDRKISILKEQMFSTTIRTMFPNMFDDKDLKNLFKSGGSIFEGGSGLVNPQASISLKGHTDYGVGVLIEAIQGLAESAVIAAAAQARANVSTQFDGVDVEITDKLEEYTRLNNEAVAQIWQKLNVFEIFRDMLQEFATNLNKEGNEDLLAIIDYHLKVQANAPAMRNEANIGEGAEDSFEPGKKKQNKDAKIPEQTFPKRLKETKYAKFDKYGDLVSYSPWQQKLGKALYNLVRALDMQDILIDKDGRTVSYNFFMQKLFDVQELPVNDTMSASEQQERARINEQIKKVHDAYYEKGLLGRVLLEAQAKLTELANDSAMRRQAWNHTGTTQTDQLASLAIAAETAIKSLSWTDAEGIQHHYEPVDFFANNRNADGSINWDTVNTEETLKHMTDEVNTVYSILQDNTHIVEQTVAETTNALENFSNKILAIKAEQELLKLHTGVQNAIVNTGSPESNILSALAFSKKSFAKLMGLTEEQLDKVGDDANVIYRLVEDLYNAKVKGMNPFLENTMFLALSNAGITYNDDGTENTQELDIALDRLYGKEDSSLKRDIKQKIINEAHKSASWSGIVVIDSTQKHQIIVLNNAAIKANNANRSEVILHELMHASFDQYADTYVVVHADGTLSVSQSLKAIDPIAYSTLQLMVEMYSSELPRLAENANIQNILPYIKAPENATTAHRKQAFKEFVAYSLSNKELAKALAQGREDIPSFTKQLRAARIDIKENKAALAKFGEKLLKFIQTVESFLKRIFDVHFKNYSTKPNELERFGKSALNNIAWGFQTILRTNSYGQLYNAQRNQAASSISHYQILSDISIKATSPGRTSWAVRKTASTFAKNITQGKLTSPNFKNRLAVIQATLLNIFPEQSMKENRETLSKIMFNWLMVGEGSPVNSEFGQRYASLVQQITPLLTEDIFYENDNPTEEEKRNASLKLDALLDLYDEPMRSNDSFQQMPQATIAILAMALINPRLQEKLKNTTIAEEQYKAEGLHTLDDFLGNISAKADQWVQDNLDPVIASDRNLYDAVNDIHQEIHTFLDKVDEKLGSPINDLFNAADIKAYNFITKQLHKARESDSRAAQALAGVGLMLFDENDSSATKTSIMHIINTTNAPEFIRNLASDIFGTRMEDMPLFQLVKRIKGQVDQLRQSYRKQIPSEIRQMFNNSLSADEWESLYTSVGQTGIYSLSLYAPELMDRLPLYMASGSRTLAKDIANYEARVQEQLASGAKAQVLNKTQQLGHYMATGEAGNFLLRNTWAIAMKYNRYVDSKLENDLSVLATLYAFQELSAKDKQIFRQTWEAHMEGMKNLIQLVTYIQQTEQNKLKVLTDALNNANAFQNNAQHEYYRIRMNAYQNYMPTDSIEGSDMMITDDSKKQELRQFGYVRVGDYNNSLDKKTKKGYYYSTLSRKAKFSNGLFVVTSPTYNGIYVNTGSSVQGAGKNIISDTNEVKRITAQMNNLKNTPQSSSGDDLIPLFALTPSGKVEVYAYERSFSKKQNHRINSRFQLADSIGIALGRQIEETASQIFNASSGSILLDEYKQSRSSAEFIDILDEKQLNAVQKDAVNRIPLSVLNIIKQQFMAAGEGEHIYIRKDLLKDVIGYRKMSVREIFDPMSSDLNKHFLKGLEWCMKKAFGENAFRYAVRGEEAVQGLVSWAKASIVVRSVRLCMINGVANIYHLNANGVPLTEIMRELPKMYSQCEIYSKSFRQLRSLDMQIAMSKNPGEIRQLQLQKKALETKIQALDIYPVIDEFSVINELGRSVDDLKLTRGQWGEWVVDFVNKYVPEPVRNVGRYALMAQDTAIYQGLEKATQYGDFIAKAILYKHWVKNHIYTSTEAKKLIMEEFVNYDKNAGRMRQYWESIGLGWFFNYRLRIMHTAERMLRNHPVRALTTMIMPHPGFTGDDVGDVFKDSIIGKSLDGLGFSNLGWGFFKMAWDSLPMVALFGLL